MSQGNAETNRVMTPLFGHHLPSEQYNRIYEAVALILLSGAPGIAARLVEAIRAALEDRRTGASRPL